MTAQRTPILLVEDDDHDVFFLRRALLKARPDLSLHVVTDGEQALDYLDGRRNYADRTMYPLPSLMFLDLKLPYFNGFQILEHLRGIPALAEMPVFVLTSSSEDRDRNRAIALGAKAYLVKPPTAEMLLQVLESSAKGASDTG
jgi:CheY-like chemotaxis protein